MLEGDAADPANYRRADVMLACGIFGNISDDDVRRTVGVLPALVAFWIRRNIPESPRWERSNRQRRAAYDRRRQGAVLQGEDAAIVRFTLVDMFAEPAVRSWRMVASTCSS